jgi:hypothetical protein
MHRLAAIEQGVDLEPEVLDGDVVAQEHGSQQSGSAVIVGRWSMLSAPMSILPRRWASATADMPAIKLASKGSRNSAADLGMPSNSTCPSRCTAQSAGGKSIWSRSRKLSE